MRYRVAMLAGPLAIVALLGALFLVTDEDQDVAADDAGARGSTTVPPMTAPEDDPERPAPPTTPTTTATTDVGASTPSEPTPGDDSTAAPTTVPAPTTTTAPVPPYRSSIEPVNESELGASWTPGLGCTDPAGLRAVDVTHWGYDGTVREGRIIVAADQAEQVRAIFGDLYLLGFPIERIEPIDRYGGDDQASMRANNTSGYNCRNVSGTSSLSQHAFGLAIDVNPLVNPYVRSGSVDPPEGAPWADRQRDDPGMIHPGDAVVDAFALRGWSWGGYWTSGQDYQHFSVAGT